MKVRVTREDIKNGVRGDSKSLPVFGAPEAKKSKRLGTGGGGRNDMIGDRP